MLLILDVQGELGYDTNIKQRYHWDSHQMDNSEGHHSTLWFLDPDYLDTGYFTCYYGDYNSTYDASAPNDHVYIFFSSTTTLMLGFTMMN